jgi:hypothetical protein
MLFGAESVVGVAESVGKALTGSGALVDGQEFGLMKGAAREKTSLRVCGVLRGRGS